ncbi:MAG: chorismate mutase [Treponema sp.]|nr:chorismate mutase [Treponema sp.]MBQ7619487.1 chorismate mutase [Treponema sp.]
MEKRIYAVRGAIFAENTKDSIQEKAVKLFNAVVEKNAIKSQDIVSLHWTLTKDLDAMNPATALRLGKPAIDVSEIPLFCSQEAFIQGGRPKVIRMMLTAYLEQKPSHIFLDGAEALRPDFSK